jgi:hypothetical protein
MLPNLLRAAICLIETRNQIHPRKFITWSLTNIEILSTSSKQLHTLVSVTQATLVVKSSTCALSPSSTVRRASSGKICLKKAL